jgi:hypothetical protein
MNDKFIHVFTSEGLLNAEMIRTFLEAKGIQVVVSQESAGVVLGLSVGSLGKARFYVRAEQAEEAKSLLEAMERGDFALPDEDTTESSDQPEEDPKE